MAKSCDDAERVRNPSWQGRQAVLDRIKRDLTRKELVMKFVVTWKNRSGASAADNEAAAARTLEVFGKWSPPSDETFHQFLGRLDGTGGFAVVETDNPDSLAEAPAKFGTYLDFEIIPVNDITETTRLLGEGVEFRKSI
jgi:hypothetical protein